MASGEPETTPSQDHGLSVRWQERRTHSRIDVDIAAQAVFGFGQLSVQITDISLGGARIRLSSTFVTLPERFLLDCEELGPIQVRSRWRGMADIGVQFLYGDIAPRMLRDFIYEMGRR